MEKELPRKRLSSSVAVGEAAEAILKNLSTIASGISVMRGEIISELILASIGLDSTDL